MTPKEKICIAKDCMSAAYIAIIIHHHAKSRKCNPYDNKMHSFYELCKPHYKQLHRDGQDSLPLKEEYYIKK